MALYHFTSAVLINGIFKRGIKPHPHAFYDDILKKYSKHYNLCWFTTTPEANATGVPDGSRKLSDSELLSMQKQTGMKSHTNGQYNKHAVRITLTKGGKDSCEKLTKWGARNNISRTTLKYYGLTAKYGSNLNLSDKKLEQAFRSKKSSDEINWYVNEHVVSPLLFESVEYKEDGVYIPLSYKNHVTPALEKSGIIVLPNEYCADITGCFTTQHPFDFPDISFFCDTEDRTPTLVVQSFGNVAMLEFGSKMNFKIWKFDSPSTLTQEQLTDWAYDNKALLMQYWDKAVASYRHFHPATI